MKFGLCLDFMKGITYCQGPEFCLHDHPVGVRYTRTPCIDYIDGCCEKSWSCLLGDHCALQACAELSDHGLAPPKYLQSGIQNADEAWAQEMWTTDGLKLLSIIQRYLMTMTPDKHTTYGLSSIIAEYSVLPFPLRNDPVGWSLEAVRQRNRGKVTETKDGSKQLEFIHNDDDQRFICDDCQNPQPQLVVSLGTEKMTILCFNCLNADSRGSRDDWSWQFGIPKPNTIDAALELWGWSDKDVVLTIDNLNLNFPEEGSYLVHRRERMHSGCQLPRRLGYRSTIFKWSLRTLHSEVTELEVHFFNIQKKQLESMEFCAILVLM